MQEISVGGTELQVWVADQREERNQGLRGVATLPAGIDGMLFVFAEPTLPTFVMEDTLIPLDVWFFDATGSMVGSEEMEPCPEQPCDRYPAPGPVSWALETPAGDRDFETSDRLLTSATP